MTIKQLIYFSMLFFVVSAISCTQNEKSKGNDPKAYTPPTTKPYKLTVAQSIEWEIADPENIPKPIVANLDIDKLPAKPFSVNEFEPLKAPMKEFPLNWDSRPVIPLQFDTLKINSKASIITKPVITKASNPAIIDDANITLLQLSQREGFPSNEATSFIENEDGSVWISTAEGGLCLYNGSSFYTYDFQGITDIEKDKQGRLWVSAQDAVYVLDFKKNIQWLCPISRPFDLECDQMGTMWISTKGNGFYAVDNNLEDVKKISNGGLRQSFKIIEDRHQNLWLGTTHEISVIDKERQGFRQFHSSERKGMGIPITLHEDHKGNIWVGSLFNFNGVLRSPETEGALIISLADDKIRFLGEDNGYSGITRIIQDDGKGRIWLIQNGKFTILSEDFSQIKAINTDETLFPSVPLYSNTILDSRGNIWVSSQNKGAILIDENRPFVEHLDNTDGFVSSDISELEEDSSGNIWSAAVGGINIYDPKEGVLRTLDNSLLKIPRAMRPRMIKEFQKDKYLVGGLLGFSIIDRIQKKIFHYDTREYHRAFFADVLVDRDNNFWLSGNNGLLVYDMELNQAKYFYEKTAQFPGEGTREIIEDEDGNYWIATEGVGLMIINPNENTVQYLTEKEGLCNNDVMRILPRENGELWLATVDGLSIVNTQEQTITNIGDEQGMLPDELYEIQEKDGDIYLGSVNGLIRMKSKPGKNKEWNFYNFNMAQGFPANDYKRGGAQVMKNGQLWMTARNPSDKLTVISGDLQPDTLQSQVAITGLKIADEPTTFDNRQSLKTFFETNDTLWYNEGKEFYLESTFPPDSSYLFNNDIRWDSLSLVYDMPVGLKLPYDQNSLQFNFSNFSVFNRDKIQNRYVLEGEDTNWIYGDDVDDSKTYFNLKPGKYSFKVETKGINGKWGDPDEFSFTILPPWWQTWWAYVIYIFLAIAGIWAIVQYRSRQLKAKNRLLEEKVTERTAELEASQAQLIQSEKMASLGELTAGIAHEIQNPLNFVNNFSELSNELIDEMTDEFKVGDNEEGFAIADDIKQNLAKITHHGKRADAIVKGMLAHSRSGKGEKTPTDLNALAEEYLKLSYHGLRAKDKSFNADFKTDFDPDLPKVNVVPQDIGRVLLNLINNAFQACNSEGIENPTVTVSTSRVATPLGAGGSARAIQITVTDNGPGIPAEIKDKIFQPFFTTKPTGQGTGLGLSLSYDIVKAHGGEITVESEESEGLPANQAGTTFIVTLPFKINQ